MRRVRQLGCWSFLAFFATVSIAGRGLHALPGFEHRCASGTCVVEATACRHDHRHVSTAHRHASHGGCQHSHAAGRPQPAQPPAPADNRAPHEAPTPHSGDGCLLCQFCSLAQQQTPVIELLTSGSCYAAPAPIVVRLATAFEQIYQSRAPPASCSAA
ncbi:MAG: hypothetical protein AB7U73_16580 [Pirellulales bacterium]